MRQDTQKQIDGVTADCLNGLHCRAVEQLEKNTVTEIITTQAYPITAEFVTMAI